MTRSDTRDDDLKRRVKAVYTWGDRLWSLFSLFKTKSEIAFVTAALGFAAGVSGITIADAVRTYRGAAGAEVAAVGLGDKAIVFTIVGFDGAGRSATFDMVVLKKDYGWVHGSTTELARDGRVVPREEIERDLVGGDVKTRLDQAEAVIAVGLASQEGDVAVETHRAGQRAQQTAVWTGRVVGADKPIWTLNLGRYTNPCTNCETTDTSWQRPFIVIAVAKSDPGVDLSAALADAMTGKSNIPSPSDYSAFGFAKFK